MADNTGPVALSTDARKAAFDGFIDRRGARLLAPAARAVGPGRTLVVFGLAGGHRMAEHAAHDGGAEAHERGQVVKAAHRGQAGADGHQNDVCPRHAPFAAAECGQGLKARRALAYDRAAMLLRQARDVAVQVLAGLPQQIHDALELVTLELVDQPPPGVRSDARGYFEGMQQIAPDEDEDSDGVPAIGKIVICARNVATAAELEVCIMHEVGHALGCSEEDNECLGLELLAS